MTYTFYICNNEAAMNRLSSGNTFEIHEESFETDQEAYKYALDLIDCMAEDEDELSDLDRLYDQDAGAGDPICYKIECDGEEIFDFNSDYWEKLKRKYDPDIDDDDDDIEESLEGNKFAYIDGKATFFTSKSKDEAQAYADKLNKEQLQEALKSGYVYSGVKSKEILDDIINNGFNKDSVFFSEDLYDAQGYGRFVVAVKGIDSLQLYTLDKDEIDNLSKVVEQVKATRNYDGVKYRYAEDRPYNYEIFDMANLNKLERTDATNVGGPYNESCIDESKIKDHLFDRGEKAIEELDEVKSQIDDLNKEYDWKDPQGQSTAEISKELEVLEKQRVQLEKEIKLLKAGGFISKEFEGLSEGLDIAKKGINSLKELYEELIVSAEVENKSELACNLRELIESLDSHIDSLEQKPLDKDLQESLDSLLEYYHYEPEDVDLEYDDKQELIKDWIASADKDSLIEAISEVDGDYQAFKEYLEEEQLTEETITIEQVREFLEDTSTALDKEIFDNWVDDDAKYEKRCEIAQLATEAAQDEEDIRRQYYSDRI